MSEYNEPSEAGWTAAIPVDAVGEGEPATAQAHGQEVALYRVADEFFATANLCTHGLARLSDGYLEGYLIECPLHQGVFDIRNGRCAGDPVEIDLASFDVRVRDGMIEIRPR